MGLASALAAQAASQPVEYQPGAYKSTASAQKPQEAAPNANMAPSSTLPANQGAQHDIQAQVQQDQFCKARRW
jgi:hypothetical protein